MGGTYDGLTHAANMTNTNAQYGMFHAMSVNNSNGDAGMWRAVCLTNEIPMDVCP